MRFSGGTPCSGSPAFLANVATQRPWAVSPVKAGSGGLLEGAVQVLHFARRAPPLPLPLRGPWNVKSSPRGEWAHVVCGPALLPDFLPPPPPPAFASPSCALDFPTHSRVTQLCQAGRGSGFQRAPSGISHGLHGGIPAVSCPPPLTPRQSWPSWRLLHGVPVLFKDSHPNCLVEEPTAHSTNN